MSGRTCSYACDMATSALPVTIGSELRRWREYRSLSQLALANRASVSTRHLSFVENGRSRPTSKMILRLAEVLEVPMGEQNNLLMAGGFAPLHPAHSIDDPELSAVMNGVRSLIDAHDPYPALLLDDSWDIIDANHAIDALVTGCDPVLLEPPINVIRLALHPLGLSSRIRNLGQWRAHLIHQLRQRIRCTGGDHKLESLYAEVEGYQDRGEAAGATQGPVVLLELDADGGPLRFFSVASRIVGPADVTVDSLHLETFLPADARTRASLSDVSDLSV